MNDRDYAIVIGIRYPQLFPLRATLTDATKFIEWLTSAKGGGVPAKNIATALSDPKLPRDPRAAVPIKRHIDDALIKFGVERQTEIGRRLYFYFAGHGFGPTYNEVVLLMADASDRRLNSNIGLQHLLGLFHDSPLFEELVVVLDCCRDPNPPKRRFVIGAPDPTPEITEDPPQVKQLLFLAASYGEKAYEVTDKATGERRGLLTQAVLEGLSERKNRDARGLVTAEALSQYVSTQVRALAKKAGDPKLDQMPEISANPFPLDMTFGAAAGAGGDRVPVRIVAPAGLTGDLVVADSEGNEIARRPAADATEDQPPWNVDLVRDVWFSVSHSEDPTETGVRLVDDWSALEENGHVFVFPAPE